ncbi:hypothetical protein [uncultured Muribaculum sp.]|uniref:hypothetical protein n=1 Tax=uncultured Muribaculum sp. TaxID=1918613 RepID=UPI0025B55ECF|nr:hypothetical protein [uncultured Muribaculum sp.]
MGKVIIHKGGIIGAQARNAFEALRWRFADVYSGRGLHRFTMLLPFFNRFF